MFKKHKHISEFFSYEKLTPPSGACPLLHSEERGLKKKWGGREGVLVVVPRVLQKRGSKV